MSDLAALGGYLAESQQHGSLAIDRNYGRALGAAVSLECPNAELIFEGLCATARVIFRHLPIYFQGAKNSRLQRACIACKKVGVATRT